MKGAIEPLTEPNMTITDLAVRTLDNSTKKIALDAIADLRSKLRGSVALPGEDGYDTARTIWNAMVDRRPAALHWQTSTRRRRHSGLPRRSGSIQRPASQVSLLAAATVGPPVSSG